IQRARSDTLSGQMHAHGKREHTLSSSDAAQLPFSLIRYFFPERIRIMWIHREKYIEMMKDTNWAPGWDAIRDAFSVVYGDTGTYRTTDTIPGMRSSLEGFGVYQSQHGYTHIVTRGMSQIHPHKDACNNKTSGWGLEFSIKCPDADPDLPRAFHILDWLAEGIDIRKDGWSMLYPQEVKLDDVPEDLLAEPGSTLALIPDTEIPFIDTIHGEVNIRQVIGISAKDNEQLRRFPSLMKQVIFELSKKNAYLLFH
ncbi:MAG: suppressor of fused domain protein, partial [Clostridia bacterium]|nr:suppressor of fused domain protein [Clostridia bacterium]